MLIDGEIIIFVLPGSLIADIKKETDGIQSKIHY
jgi:hypothetical protein